MAEAHEGMIWTLSWHPLGHILASGSNDHSTFVPPNLLNFTTSLILLSHSLFS